MEKKRLKQIIKLWLTLDVGKRTKYLKEKGIFGAIGDNCSIMDRKVPLYAELIKIGNNVHIASKVDFITHDITHAVINNKIPKTTRKVPEKIGCIEILDNVFVGSNVTILGNVRIGNNVIVAAGTLVNKDIQDNSVVAGVPAKVVGSFDDFVEKRLKENIPDIYRSKGQRVSKEAADYYWKVFYTEREE